MLRSVLVILARGMSRECSVQSKGLAHRACALWSVVLLLRSQQITTEQSTEPSVYSFRQWTSIVHCVQLRTLSSYRALVSALRNRYLFLNPLCYYIDLPIVLTQPRTITSIFQSCQYTNLSIVAHSFLENQP